MLLQILQLFRWTLPVIIHIIFKHIKPIKYIIPVFCLEDFTSASIVIESSPNKSCELDTIRTWLFKSCLHERLPVLIMIVHTPLETVHELAAFKSAYVRPLLKKLNILHLYHIYYLYLRCWKRWLALVWSKFDIKQPPHTVNSILLKQHFL